MKQLSSLIAGFILLLLTEHVTARLIGFGIKMYDPLCAVACWRTLRNVPLQCTANAPGTGGHGHGAPPATSSDCRSTDEPWLTTIALCIDTYCSPLNVPLSKKQRWWEISSTNSPAVPPKWSYEQALAQIQDRETLPEVELTELLNGTGTAPLAVWEANYRTFAAFEYSESSHSRYAIVLAVFLFATPILATLVGRLPYMTGVYETVRPYFVYPSLIGTYHVRPLPFALGNAPLVGHTLFIAIFFSLVLIFSGVDIKSVQPNTIYRLGVYEETLLNVANRTGHLAYGILPLMVLFASRNNLLLWLTNWSHSTYLLLHRWVARAFTILAIVHSILELVAYKHKGTYAAEEKTEYWIWGAVATVAASVSIVFSGLYVRKWQYEIFLITHILLAIFIFAGCWYHIVLYYGLKWGYQDWVIAASAAWFVDRVWRILRIMKNGVRRSKVTEIGNDIVRIDIKGVRWGATPGQHCYAYFPTLKPLRPWENHPFSSLPSSILHPGRAALSSPDSASGDLEKNHDSESALDWVAGQRTTAGLTFFVRKSAGLTDALRSHDRLLTLLDGPYPNNPTEAILRCDRVLLIAGGIGITGVLPWITTHPNVKLCWSVKKSSEALALELEDALGALPDKDVRVGRRLDIEALLEGEVQAGWKKIGVVVCGPGSLCDDARALVVAAAKKGPSAFELEVDAYSW